ncbi:MAG: methylmalonyl Co-A mutase-associated GTPase MeaB [Bacteroidota bacterium]|nr:methylmalonyl Co-A mutase-associated GTPase MeaB [Bacteroidota bacterium]
MAGQSRQDKTEKVAFRKIARNISLVENEAGGYEQILEHIKPSAVPVIGITGPPGAGKSTLTDALIAVMISKGERVGVLCIDPSSPFHRGALLGDRIRMSRWYNHPDVYIRSLASKGSLGGLHPKIIEITDLMKDSGFDRVLIETVGVGQSEVDIARLADLTLVVLVPEGGDTIQAMKAGLMEVADIFIVNKFDRPDAASFYRNLQQILGSSTDPEIKKIPVLKMTATQNEGVEELYERILQWPLGKGSGRSLDLMTEKAWALIQEKKMKGLDRGLLKTQLEESLKAKDFNLYRFVNQYTAGSSGDED